jgi:hypothetical protein
MQDQLLAASIVSAEPCGPAPSCDAYTAGLDGGVLRVSWDDSVTVSEKDALSLTARVYGLCPSAGVPMLVELNAMVSLSRAALHMFATDLQVPAMALVGASVVDETLADFFIRVHEPPYPTRYFTTVSAARTWLTGYR